MKKIINGLRYDTGKAIKIGSYPNKRGDWEATLYKTPRSRRFFLAGDGNKMSRFLKTKIIPMTKEEALEWAEQYLNAEDIEKHFQDQIEKA